MQMRIQYREVRLPELVWRRLCTTPVGRKRLEKIGIPHATFYRCIPPHRQGGLLDEPDNLELLGRGVPHAAQPDQNSNGSALGFSVDREAQGIDPDTAYRAARSLPYHLALQ